MKKIFLLLLLYNSVCNSQNYSALKINESFNFNELSKREIYSINKSEFKNLVFRSNNKKYHLFVSFGIWCSPCMKNLPNLIQFAEQNKDLINLYIVLIEKDKSKALNNSKTFFDKINYDYPVFMIGEKYGSHKREKYKNFLIDIIGEKDFSELYLGMFEHILFSNDFQILYKSTYNDVDKETLEKINLIISKK